MFCAEESVIVCVCELREIILTLIWGLHVSTQFLGIVVNKDSVVQVEWEVIDKTVTVELRSTRIKDIFLEKIGQT